MKRELLCCTLAVSVTEGTFAMLAPHGFPSRFVPHAYPEITAFYGMLFPVFLLAALAAVRLRWRISAFVGAVFGTVSGTLLGALTFLLAQLADPRWADALRTSIARFGWGEVMAIQVYAGLLLGSCLHGGLAGLLVGLFTPRCDGVARCGRQSGKDPAPMARPRCMPNPPLQPRRGVGFEQILERLEFRSRQRLFSQPATRLVPVWGGETGYSFHKNSNPETMTMPEVWWPPTPATTPTVRRL